MSRPDAIGPVVANKPPVSPVSNATPVIDLPTVLAAKITASVTLAGTSLEVATGIVAEVGASIDDILQTVKHGSDDFTRDTFDATLAQWNKTFSEVNADSSTVKPEALRYWSVFAAMKACEGLGVDGLDRIAVKRWTRLIPHAFIFDRKDVKATIKTGWADWLKQALPLNVTGPNSMSSTSLEASVEMQVDALHDLDPTLYPARVTRKPSTDKPASKNSKTVANAKSASKAKAETKVEPKVEATPVKEVPAPGTPNTENMYTRLAADLAKSDPTTRQQMVKALMMVVVALKDDDAVLAAWSVLESHVDRIELGNVPKLLTNVA